MVIARSVPFLEELMLVGKGSAKIVTRNDEEMLNAPDNHANIVGRLTEREKESPIRGILRS
jgi:hypothetical protein